MIDHEYESMTSLAKRYNTTSHVFGRWLAEAGLRTVGGSPTVRAFELGLVRKASTGRGDGSGYYYIWHAQLTTDFLRQARADHERLDNGSQPTTTVEAAEEIEKPTKPLIGPFDLQASGDGWQIVNRDGQTFLWAMDSRVARTTVDLYQLAYRHRAHVLDNDWEAEERQ